MMPTVGITAMGSGHFPAAPPAQHLQDESGFPEAALLAMTRIAGTCAELYTVWLRASHLLTQGILQQPHLEGILSPFYSKGN